MKKIFSLFAALFLAFAFAGSAMAKSYTITFKTATSDGSNAIAANTKTSTVISAGINYVSGFTSNCDKAYYACKSGVKLGSSSAVGTLEFNITDTCQANIKTIIIKSAQYGSDNGKLTVYNGSTSIKSGITPGTNDTITFEESTTVASIKITTSTKRAYVSEIILVTGAPSTTPSLELSATSINFGKVEQGATVAAKSVTATLANTDYAAATLSGTNASAFEITAGAELTETGSVSVRPTAAALAVPGTYSASLDIDADGVSGTKSVTLSLVVVAPFDGKVWTITQDSIKVLDSSQSSGYAKYQGVQTHNGMDFYISDVYPYDNSLQFKKTVGQIYNKKDFGQIAKIEITTPEGKSNNLNVYFGTSENPSSNLVEGTTSDGVATYEAPAGTFGFFKLLASAATNVTPIKVYYYSVFSPITLASCTNGTVSATGAADLSSVEAGTIITLSNTPAAGYKLSSYSVKATADASKVVTINEDNGIYTFVMPSYAVTISATFEEAKVLNSVAITTPATTTEFWKGDAFTAAGLVLTASFASGDEVVSPDSIKGYDMSTAGTQLITVYYSEGATTKTATYNIVVKTIANTQATAYTTAEAIALIKAGKDLSSTVFVKGTVSKVDRYDETSKYITYWLDGNTFEAFHGKGLNNTDFEAIGDVEVGANVIICGTLTKYGTTNVTYELASGNYLVSYALPLTMSIVYNAENQTVTFTPSNANEYYFAYAAPDAFLASEDLDTYVEDNILDGLDADDWEDLIDPATGDLFKGTKVVDISEFAASYTGNWTAFANFVHSDLSYETTITKAFIVPDTATGLDNAEAEVKAVKTLENDQLIIIKNGVRYNALGAKL